MPKKAIFDKKNVLVIGGAGFIGSHLCDELIKTSKVICIDNFSTGDEKNIDHLLADNDFEFIRHDINEPIDLDNLQDLQKFKIQFQGIQEIYNLACPTSPNDFEKNKILTLLTNSFGVKNALDLAIKYEAKFLHFSSSVVYGPKRGDNQKISESDLGIVDNMSERSAYDEGKRFSETMVVNFRKKYNIDTKIVRLFRIYGPRMKLNDGQMIPDFVNNAIDDKNLEVYGDNNFSSSFCYIDDCIDAVLKIMDSDINSPINIGSDIEVKLTDVAQKIITILESESKIEFIKEKFFVTPLCLPDIGMARTEIGWMPVVTLEQGLKKTIYELRASKGLKRT
ncbi:hypothetical protein A2331_01480 [Candidatus Falkowbacteria bacterium RIFOXYB2_FULL_34_18]|uniref:NAD-dependent epimerase/dehydratase domain-containing protein n=1 Tax=Candidatus Falkowbacteria bacterium RIFOXYD2_FULL_34_120 TaxID=1798007 RepID=A0A1F5TQU5_9BACT|nr:MAG: hypothetical protein A2331_01480 [Candidatus Falkowbacteria bacterium RIFOXYB2_FULL_34_18]OGF29287.1 MAG: hypothetical protein A2500_05360 [Candidatus Falkowbacteria bacterium RIFOXYC12_FULL_34_55]OGF36403.1 MAG: hypothetical protein A2466_01020 [Candidatus Falkowbacteria bacterium RIFOXYC2_FULL_34_220]OGF38882.1 MAG: hypothetical protein A2515_05780 [Candidatus Falkowbacteria bacterium RIFOXYD12_FULL_34_57]OGF40901.1 MAG: hypothetical protein A2531_04005 [Candidatus Falkowbacteria bact